ncbi:MAG TPA: uridine kinase [Candidatus Polarisedimenticolaceae bacterium]|nr:uridine kinase [Candidatus Polarisedimenticolaceae bacterium]
MGAPPSMIGIAGGSCSGKSTIAARLAERLGSARAPVVALDSYYRDRRELERLTGSEPNWDDPVALDRALMIDQLVALSRGASVDLPVYDFNEHRRTADTLTIVPGTHVIAEGLFTLRWSELRALWRLSVFVEVDDDTGRRRRIARDTRERGRDRASVERQWRLSVRPMYRAHVAPTRRYADLALDGTRPVDESLRAIVAQLAPDQDPD